ncbi:SRPBCC family protein [Subtercola boreus]|uniref:Polyketide cyclase n=1 Tax=Subtercola boreus TaxID=120213 RepID=A0A3E0WGZ1_9MICO|nr:SRPBCC family protein [Subtercola boreus]RFA23401.1 hypothetical protein B7R24_00425 [Subtercola boreus]RFA23794.1 hypothetical protein B7R23_00425 [Subtercola boreus]RFA29495.1 hypothetical protein B7R25_00420 [Subtercola boreus]
MKHEELIMFTVVGVSFSPPPTAFDVVVPRDDTTLFTGYLKVLPAVVDIVDFEGGEYDHPGASRTVKLSDGGSFREQIVRFERPGGTAPDAAGHFDYDVSAFTGILGGIVSDGVARWTYAHGSTGRTHITWTYGYRPLPGRRFIMKHLIGPLWMRYMRRGMAACLRAIVEARRESKAAAAAAFSSPSGPDLP